jgi:hypothetical protein
MPTKIQCLDDPTEIRREALCLAALSKNLKGDLKLGSSKAQKCKERECVSLKVTHALKLKVIAAGCDSPLSKPLDGLFTAKLVSAFETDGDHRALHAGEFGWSAANGVKITGRMIGVTNVGTHRLPIKECQTCKDVGIMEGQLCGQVSAPRGSPLQGCQVRAAYRIRFDPSEKGGSGAVVGTLEGLVLCFC